MTNEVLIALIGVIGTLMGSSVGIIGNRLAERTRAKNENRLYISRTQYDLQLDVYRNLTKKFFSLIVDLTTIYSDDHYWL